MPRRLYSGFSFVALMFVLAAMVCADLHRGPWYDEFYTQFVTRPGVPWGQALRESWLADNHPPLFYMLARASNWLGAVPVHRLLNPALGLVAVAGAWVVLRDLPVMAPAGAGLALALAAGPWTLLAGSELRSYFLSLCAGALLALSLAAIRIGARDRGVSLVYAISAMVAFNVHIVTSLTAGALILPFLLEAFVRRDWREARVIAIPALAGGLVFTATSVIQLPLWLANTQVFWIEPGFSSGRWAVEWAVLHTLSGNVLLVAGALAGAGLMAWRRGAGEGSALLLLVCGLGIAAAGLIAVHMVRPLLIEKYLTGLVGALCVVLALGFGRLLRVVGLRWGAALLVLALALSALSLWRNTQQAILKPGWLGTGRAIAAMVAQCPGAVVHTDPRWNANVLTALPQDNRLVVPFAYRSMADDLGFSLAPAGSKAMARACPTIFWGEHDGAHHFNRDIVLADLRQAGFPVTTLTFRRIDDGWLAIAPAP